MDILHWSQVFVFCSMGCCAHVFYWEDDVLQVGGRIGRVFTVPTTTAVLYIPWYQVHRHYKENEKKRKEVQCFITVHRTE